MKWRLSVVLLLILTVALPTAAQPAEESNSPYSVEVREAFLIAEDGARIDGDPIARPGQLVGLVLDWGGDRPEAVALTPRSVADLSTGSATLPRRFVAADPRAAGLDVLEVLVLSLQSTSVEPIDLVDGDAVVARTTPFEISVEPALAEDDSLAAPARGQRSVGLDLLAILLLAAAAALVLGVAGYLVWRLLRTDRGSAGAVATPAAPAEPAHLRALRELKELRESGLLERGELKAYSVTLAEIGKRYVASLSSVPLLERTTFECRQLLTRAGFAPSDIEWLHSWLTRIDLIKFAGARPASDVLLDQATALESYVTRTQPAEAPGSARPSAAQRGIAS